MLDPKREERSKAALTLRSASAVGVGGGGCRYEQLSCEVSSKSAISRGGTLPPTVGTMSVGTSPKKRASFVDAVEVGARSAATGLDVGVKT